MKRPSHTPIPAQISRLAVRVRARALLPPLATKRSGAWDAVQVTPPPAAPKPREPPR